MSYLTSRVLLKVRNFHYFRKCWRLFSSDNTFSVEQLHQRKLLEIKGTDTTEFLQGLTTNDISLLEDNTCQILYSVMLNQQGRILYDLLISSTSANDVPEYLIECDHEVVDELKSVLQMYRLRKKVSMEVRNDLCAWSVITNARLNPGTNFDTEAVLPSTPVLCSPSRPSQGTVLHNIKKINNSPVKILSDPRLEELGARLYLPKDVSPYDVYNLGETKSVAAKFPYTSLRYQLGIGEGILDLPPGKALPLESNVDFLHGVSFHKGCYIGQELTARTYHTGVIRKRLVPFNLDEQVNVLPQIDSSIEDENGKAIGKFRSIHSKYGLALIRLQQASKAKAIKIGGDVHITLMMPYWWPHRSAETSL